MKYLIILSGVACLSFMLLPACAPAPEPEPEATPEPQFDQAAEEAAVRQVIEQVLAVLNNHDAKALASLFIETYETWDGEVKGIEAYENDYSDFFERQKDLKYQFQDEIGLIFLKPDVAIYKGRGEFTDMLDDDGNTLPPQEYRHAWILMKENGKWLVAALFSALEESAA
jgi:uncharacterized protein (TIGR02246 family)